MSNAPPAAPVAVAAPRPRPIRKTLPPPELVAEREAQRAALKQQADAVHARVAGRMVAREALIALVCA